MDGRGGSQAHAALRSLLVASPENRVPSTSFQRSAPPACMLSAILLCTCLMAGCDGETGGDGRARDVGQVANALYQTGQLWPSGNVPVCYSVPDGDYPDL